jgi:hypothetical protein
MTRNEQANYSLATLLGWHNLALVGGGAILGTPPGGAPNSRGQAMVPDWCGDWAHAGPLMVEHGAYPKLHCPDSSQMYVRHEYAGGTILHLRDFPNREAAVRFAVVAIVTESLRVKRRVRSRK